MNSKNWRGLSDRALTELRLKVKRAHFFTFHKYGLTYQTCRFCGGGQGAWEGLFKYGVRHYICPSCRMRVDPALPRSAALVTEDALSLRADKETP